VQPTKEQKERAEAERLEKIKYHNQQNIERYNRELTSLETQNKGMLETTMTKVIKTYDDYKNENKQYQFR
jgi:hypothetical protein